MGEPGKSLQTYDFASDKKKLKKKIRVMLKIVKNINGEQLANLDEIEENARVKVQCITCHRGQKKPELIQDVLANELLKGDINSVIKMLLYPIENTRFYWGTYEDVCGVFRFCNNAGFIDPSASQ